MVVRGSTCVGRKSGGLVDGVCVCVCQNVWGVLLLPPECLHGFACHVSGLLLTGWLVGWLVSWLVDWLVGWSLTVFWLVGWVGGWHHCRTYLPACLPGFVTLIGSKSTSTARAIGSRCDWPKWSRCTYVVALGDPGDCAFFFFFADFVDCRCLTDRPQLSSRPPAHRLARIRSLNAHSKTAAVASRLLVGTVEFCVRASLCMRVRAHR